MKVWKPIKNFWKKLFEGLRVDFKAFKDSLPNFIKKKLGIEITPEKDLNDLSGLSEISKKLLFAGEQKSQTDVNITVGSDSGSTASIDKVKSKGPANVNLATVGYLGV